MDSSSSRGWRRDQETTGFLLSVVFVCLASVRDVYLGGLFQRVSPLAVAVAAFSLCCLVFLPIALARQASGVAAFLRRPRELFWINATSAIAWISFFYALRSVEPSLVQILFFGVGPLSVVWIDRLVPGAGAPRARTRAERRLHLGLLASLTFAAAVVLGGRSGLGVQPLALAAGGVALAVGGGVAISVNTLLCRAMNEAGLSPVTVLSLRFPGTIVLAAALAALSPDPVGVTPAALGVVAIAAFLLIVLPIYVNQIGISLASPLTVRGALALGPVLVFLLQLVEGRVSSSPYSLTASLLYAVFAVPVALARQPAPSVARA